MPEKFWPGSTEKVSRKKKSKKEKLILRRALFRRERRFCGFGQTPGCFDDLAREIVRHFRFIANRGEIRGLQQLLFTVFQRIANRLLNLGIADAALAGSFARDEF